MAIYQLDVSSPPVRIGDVVCLAPSDSRLITKATETALREAGCVLGIVTALKQARSVQVTEAGIVQASITGLGNGPSSMVMANTNARCERVLQPRGGEYIVGVCNGRGSLTIQTCSYVGTGPAYTFNVTLYGAKPFPSLNSAITAANRTSPPPFEEDDSWKAIQDAIDSSGPASDPDNSKGRTIYIPKGFYVLRKDLRVSRSCKIIGDGGLGRYASSVLVFQDGHGMFFRGSSSSGDGTRAEGAYMSDIHVYNSKRHPYHTAGIHGISVDCRVNFERVSVTDFGGDGIHIDASIAQDRNANSWSLKDIFVEDNENGLTVQGGNTNGGVAINVLALSNREYGIYNSSFLGSTFVGCLAEANIKSFRSDKSKDEPSGGVNRSVWIGCYSESGQRPEQMYHPAIVIGGTHGAGFSEDSTALRILNSSSISPMSVNNEHDRMETWLGLEGQNRNGILGWRETAEQFGYLLDYDHYYSGYYALHNEATQTPTFFLSGLFTEDGPGSIWFRDGFLIGGAGGGGAMLKQVVADQEPRNGLWRQGDIIWNSSVQTQGSINGWRCILNGGWGEAWTQNRSTFRGHYVLGIGPSTASNDRRVYRCINITDRTDTSKLIPTAVTGTTEPAWPGESRTVTEIGTYREGDITKDAEITWKDFGISPIIRDDDSLPLEPALFAQF